MKTAIACIKTVNLKLMALSALSSTRYESASRLTSMRLILLMICGT